MARVKGFVEMASEVAVIVLACVVVLSMIRQYSAGTTGTTVVRQGLMAGSEIHDVPHISYDRAKRTVLLFLNSRCAACLQGVRDYVALRRLLEQGYFRVQVFGVFQGESQGQLEEYRKLGFPFPIRQVEDFSYYGISGTPTVVIVDPTGRIRDFWIGRVQATSVMKRLTGDM